MFTAFKRLITVAFLLTHVLLMSAQMIEPVHFSATLKTGSGPEAEIVFSATIDKGWHVYSTDIGQDGPIAATFNVDRMEGVETVGKLQPRGNVIKQYDEMFGMELKYFEGTATFVQKIRFTKPEYAIDCYLEYGACNDQSCLPPSVVELHKEGKSPVKQAADDKPSSQPNDATPIQPEPPRAEQPEAPRAEQPEAPDSERVGHADYALSEAQGEPPVADSSLLYILLMGFIGGLLAVCMPCIWPIIPMTVSFFLKRSKTTGVRDAMAYGISIIVIYLGLGLLVTAAFGPDTLNAMSTNAIFNIFLFILLVAFALSFFGWFEIKLPSSWANKVDKKSGEVNTVLSIFLMAFTLALVSFSCTAPIIGLLLVETTTTGNFLAPAVGMFGFAVALALPFTLFALFPSWLKQAPKSGSWMTTVKVVLGFIELAFALKFLSVADLAYGWHLLDREVFLSLWIAIFALLGAYLCGWLKFQQDQIGGQLHKPMPVACIMGGLLSFAFAIYMIPGLWGAPCKAVSAFAPPMNTQDFNLNTKVVEAKYTDYDEGMAAAKAQGKPVLLDFTGYGCVNCRKMEAAVWTDPTVADLLTNHFVLISLYVDDKTPLNEPVEVKDTHGHVKTLRTVGAKWSHLQTTKFGANAQPFYVMLDNHGNPLAPTRGYDEDKNEYIKFLRTGLQKYGR